MSIDILGLINRATLFMRDHSPELLVLGGVGGAVVGGVMACKATTKLPEVKHEAAKRLETMHAESSETESDSERRRRTTRAYLKTGLAYVKLYAPSCIVGGLSIASILAGNHILRKRHVALAAAYATLDTGFRQYRARVAGQYGEDAERQIRYDIHEHTIEETVTDEDGKQKTVSKTVEVACGISEYARYFEQGASRAWDPSDTYNRSFLELQQRLANDQLRVRGYLFLNDVYDMLGYERTKAGQIVGWVYDPQNANKLHTDNYVDFGIRPIYRHDQFDPDGFVETYLLDFNVDGPVLNRVFPGQD